ncbi:MAG: Fe-S cluster assembly ATPase SufC [Nanoarchaeota archaeon]|nr:Fe-S cluster assembly ATPase SufC [Nanoarchaeota archaeon]
MLQLKNINVSINEVDTPLLQNINLEFDLKKITMLMGPNGAGKSSLVQAIMGNPNYLLEGSIILNSEDITQLEVEERAKKGLFLSFQQPIELPGVTQLLYLRTIVEKYNDIKIKPKEFRKQLDEAMEFLEMKKEFNQREMNVGFSGGERKKNELLQLLLLKPKIALLDEIDSGIDVDGLKTISKVIKYLQEECNTTFIIVSHHEYLLKNLDISKVIILDEGGVAKEGSKELGLEILQHGFKGKKIK